MDRFQIETENTIRQIESYHQHFSDRLNQISDFEETRLIKTFRGDLPYYYLKEAETGQRRYLGNEEKEEVKLIKEAHYCKAYVKAAEKDIDLLRKTLKGYQPLDYDSVNGMLPGAYQDAEIHLRSGMRPDKRVSDWLRRKNEIKSTVVEKYKDDLKHKSADGTLVRSKSEVIIADMLFMNKIPYVYEVPYFFDGDILNLDFTILSPVDYETEIVIEHQGMMDKQAYRDKYMHTLLTCLGHGMVPNVDIYFTFDDLSGSFDSRQVWDIINNRLKKQKSSAI